MHSAFYVRDLWRRANLTAAAVEREMVLQVPAHGVRLLRMWPALLEIMDPAPFLRVWIDRLTMGSTRWFPKPRNDGLNAEHKPKIHRADP